MGGDLGIKIYICYINICQQPPAGILYSKKEYKRFDIKLEIIKSFGDMNFNKYKNI